MEPEVAISLALAAADEALYTAKREGRARIGVRSKGQNVFGSAAPS
jgi:PleD family two-component response regulator